MAFPQQSSKFQTAGSSIMKKGIVGSRYSSPATSSLHRTVQRIDKTTAVKIISRVQDPSQPNKRRVTLEYFDQKSSKPKKMVLICRNHQDTNQQHRPITKEKEIIREDPMKRVRERRALEIQQRLEKERLEKLRREEQERLAKERLQQERKAARRALEKMEREADYDNYYKMRDEAVKLLVIDLYTKYTDECRPVRKYLGLVLKQDDDEDEEMEG